MTIGFTSLEETYTLHTKGDNINIIMGKETNAIIEKLRESLLQKLEESMRVSKFVSNSVDLLYYHLTAQQTSQE